MLLLAGGLTVAQVAPSGMEIHEWEGGDHFTTELFEAAGEWELVLGAWCHDGVSFVQATVFDQDGEQVGEVMVVYQGIVKLALDTEPGLFYVQVWSPDMIEYRWEMLARPLTE